MEIVYCCYDGFRKKMILWYECIMIIYMIDFYLIGIWCIYFIRVNIEEKMGLLNFNNLNIVCVYVYVYV